MSSQDQLENNQKFINRFDFINNLINDIKNLDNIYSLQASGNQLDSQGKLLGLVRAGLNDADFKFIICSKKNLFTNRLYYCKSRTGCCWK